jgi:hypothetical protein
MALFLSADIHQGDECFNILSRGKQCAFMSLSAILTAQHSPLIDWSKTTLNNVLMQGDKMYLKALDNGLFNLAPGVEFLSIDNLPTVVNVTYAKNMFSYEICRPVILTVETKPTSVIAAKSTLPVVVQSTKAQNILVVKRNIDLLMVVEPIEAKTIDPPIAVKPIEAKTIDPPIVVEPIEAKTTHPHIVVEPIEAQTITDLPIMVEHIEAENNNQIWSINYGKELQGLVMTDQEIESHYCDIHTALLTTILNGSHAILILEGYMMALIKQMDSFYLFDSHARDSCGMPYPDGTAVVMKFTNIQELEQHLYSLSIELHANLFEIVPVLLVSSEKALLHKASESKKRKRSEETDSARQIRLQKDRESKKRKRYCVS